jgi:hypothetical protein
MKKYIFPLIFALLASHRLWQGGYFTMQDDIHVFRLQQFDQCLVDHQIPCRLISLGGMGYSYPLFNFYSPFPYAVAEIFHLLGVSYINSLKISFILPYFIGSIGMYLLSSILFGPSGGIISSVLFTFAPYHAIDGFVRGALAEHWALNLIPIIIYSLLKSKSNLFIFSLSFLLLSHNLTALYFLPILILISIFSKRLKLFFSSSFFSISFSSFFLLPAFFEKNLTTVHSMTEGYFQYIIHFVTLNQLFFSRFWGYGASLWGPVDDMSFQIGIVHWLLAFFVIFNLKNIQHKKIILSVFFLGLFSLFLTHNRSTFIWQAIPFLAYFQFPWRFLGLTILCFSFISGSLTKNKYFVFLIIITTIVLNFNYFHEDIWLKNASDQDYLSDAKIYQQSGAGLKDYWPKYSQEYPTTMASSLPIATSGNIEIIKQTRKSNSLSGKLIVISDFASINFPITYFPNWTLFIDGIPSKYNINPKYGEINLVLSQGDHTYLLNFYNTPIRTISNCLTIFGICLYIIKLYREKIS